MIAAGANPEDGEVTWMLERQEEIDLKWRAETLAQLAAKLK